MVRGRPENLVQAKAHGPVRLVQGDTLDGKLLASLVKSADIVSIRRHCGSRTVRGNRGWRWKSWCSSTFDLLELCVRYEVESVVAASSASVYGMAEEFRTTERQHPFDNRTLYGAANRRELIRLK
jgi:UDP-glucose 4-epimerase